MRIGLLIYGSLDTLSGGYLYDRLLVDYLRRCGDRVEILSIPWRNYARHLGDNLSPALFRRLRDLKVDLLLQDELNHPSLAWLNARLKPTIRYPLVAIVHHLRSSEARQAWQNRLYRWVERHYLRSLDGFIFNSQTTQQMVMGLPSGRPEGIVAYPGGDRLGVQVSAEEIRARAGQPGPLRLFFLGNLIPRKGLHTLLTALEELQMRDWLLDVAGSQEVDPAYTRRIMSQARAAGFEKRISFLGPLQENSLVAHLRQAHLLVVPSSYEGFGIAYIEGMGLGLPAIASTAGAAHEIVTPGENGFLVPPGDHQALAAYLSCLAQDRQRLAAMGLAARQRYLSHPTWEDSLRRIRAFLHNITKHQSPPADEEQGVRTDPSYPR
ncbi:MAG TPA: glycosyltransferase family 4 protein [Anaerolineales bacterium]|nr:glycosyltransferase family 4 protein [Anaerolineales bacterium]